jgi:DNA-directed RNA polymerase specialized sigma24 family protein
MASTLSGLLKAAANPTDPRARDAAFSELLRLVGIYVRAGMGRALRDRRESLDVCQSVAKSFVDDMAAGKLQFDNEAAVAGYLQKVVKSKLAELAREDRAQKRGGGLGPQELHESGIEADDASTLDRLAQDEQWQRVMDALSDHERALIALRRRGIEWPQIAEQLGRDPAALRQQFSRLQKRVIEDLRAHGDSQKMSADEGPV